MNLTAGADRVRAEHSHQIYHRLRAPKHECDPANLFHLNQKEIEPWADSGRSHPVPSRRFDRQGAG